MFGCEFYSITTTRLCPSEYIMIDTLIHISIFHLLTFCCKLIVIDFEKPPSTSSQLWLKYLLFRRCISLWNNTIFLIRTLFTRMTNDTEIIKLCHENHLKEMWVYVGNTDPTHKTQLFSVRHVTENRQIKWHNAMRLLRTTSNQWKYEPQTTQFLRKMGFQKNPSAHTVTFPKMTDNAGQSGQQRPIS